MPEVREPHPAHTVGYHREAGYSRATEHDRTGLRDISENLRWEYVVLRQYIRDSGDESSYPFCLFASISDTSSLSEQRAGHTMSLAFEMTPPGPASILEASDPNQSGIRLPVYDHAWLKSPERSATDGSNVVALIPSTWNTRSFAYWVYDTPAYRVMMCAPRMYICKGMYDKYWNAR